MKCGAEALKLIFMSPAHDLEYLTQFLQIVLMSEYMQNKYNSTFKGFEPRVRTNSM